MVAKRIVDENEDKQLAAEIRKTARLLCKSMNDAADLGLDVMVKIAAACTRHYPDGRMTHSRFSPNVFVSRVTKL